ncbi:polysaccharide deacetylase family protein [Thermodesulfobacteriota bacterium]
MKLLHINSTPGRTLLAAAAIVMLSGCALLAPPHMYNDFMVIKAKPWDSFSSLARKYLRDPSQGWIIAEFNDLESLSSGRDIVIPLKPYNRGGLTKSSYQTVPVLAYHRFAHTASSKTIVSKAAFEQQMRFLKESGYRVISVGQLIRFLEFNDQLPDRSVVITVDDGWSSFYEIAYPILQKYGFTATIFLYTDFVGGGKGLSWEQIRELDKNGYDIQCHTKSHRSLTKLKEGKSFPDYLKLVEREIIEPKLLISRKIGKQCRYLAYPFGDMNPLILALLQKHGYRAAFTVNRGSNPFFTNRYMINRCVIYGNYDLKKFKRNLAVLKKSSR